MRWRRLRVRMRRYYPRSILRVVMLGFFVVVVPLVVALITATVYVERITAENQYAVIQATRAVRYSRQLADELRAMRRNARIYEILGDESLLKAYKSRSARFRKTAHELQGQETKDVQFAQISKLLSAESAIYKKWTVLPPGSSQARAVLGQFTNLQAMVQNILARNSRVIEQTVAHMHTVSRHVRHVLLWEASASVPVAILLCALVIIWIVRPIRAVEDNIRRLGSGDFSHPILVHGPHDIEELAARLEWLRKRLGELENQKHTFLRHMSHELKTPLASVREGAGLLSDGVAGRLNSEQEEIAGILKENTLQLQQRIEDLLDFSEAQTQLSLPQRKPLRLDQVIEEAIGEQRLTARARNLRIATELEPLSMDADVSQLRSVMDNLLSNAIKYSPDHGTIWVRLCQNHDQAVLEVQDEGSGIPISDRDRVFEAFYQGDAPVSGMGHVKGSGLGLSIARQYVKSHGGNIEVVDTDEGAHIRVRLPLRRQ